MFIISPVVAKGRLGGAKDAMEHVELDDVKYAPDTPFNVFSGSKLLQDDWTAYGCKDYIEYYSKDGQVLRFDVKISTAEGVVYAMRFKRDDTTRDAASGYNLQLTNAMNDHLDCNEVAPPPKKQRMEASLEVGKGNSTETSSQDVLDLNWTTRRKKSEYKTKSWRDNVFKVTVRISGKADVTIQHVTH